MEFIIATIAEALAHSIVVLPTDRQSVDKTKVVLHWDYVKHVDYFESFQRYLYDSKELNDLMSSPEWTYEEGTLPPNEDYAKVKAMQILTAQTTAEINKMNLSNKEKNEVKEFYPKWEDYIGESLNEVGFIVHYVGDDKLYEILQPVPVVQEHQTPNEVPSNYGWVSEHEGTKEDPIPYQHMMVIRKDKYYTQNGKLYIGLQNAPNGYAADLVTLSTLVKEIKE